VIGKEKFWDISVGIPGVVGCLRPQNCPFRKARLLVVKQPVPNPVLFVIEQLYAQILANQIYCPFTYHS
jgi:hypothetical protein